MQQLLPQALATAQEPDVFHLADVTDVLWTVTDRCNLACPYCMVVPHGRRLPPEPTRDQVDRVVGQLIRLPALDSLILSGGEALMSPHIDRILASADRIAPTRYLITNGTSLSQARRRTLLSYRPRVMVSIDALDERTNDTTRGPGSLRKALRTLEWLLDHDFYTVVIMVLTRTNLGSLESSMRGLYERGVRRVLIQQLHCTKPGLGPYFFAATPEHNDFARVARFVEGCRSTFPDLLIDDNESSFFERRPGEFRAKCRSSSSYLPQRLFMCGAGFNFFAIKRNGDVIPCNAFLDAVAGNIYTEGIEDILLDSTVMKGLRALRSHRVDRVPGCAGCPLNPICDGGCRADAYNLYGEIASKHPNCPF